jgi:asparagine synthase (glutamine-hydrolysing)
MCGVVAHLNYRGGQVNLSELLAARDEMASRGPDGAGVWTDASGCMALGHRRLAILGLGMQGAQPMQVTNCWDGKTKIVLSYNGEIYNYRELRSSLISKGHLFSGDSDTEVIAHLYEEEKQGFVKMLRGMYAFALWDDARKKLLLARDPYGIKPLYIKDDGECIRVASQVRALRNPGGLESLSEAGVTGFLLFGNVPEPFTVWSAIRAVPPGTVIAIDSQGGRRRIWQDFSLESVLTNENPHSVKLDVRETIRESVRSHLVADVEVGVFASAGVDSSAILGIAAEIDPSVRAVTLGLQSFRGTTDDEVPLAREWARQLGVRHDAAYLGADTLDQVGSRFLENMDQPSIDGLNTWLVSRTANELGLKVALSGIGGDELFGGYDSFRLIPRYWPWLRLLGKRPFVGKAARETLRVLLPKRFSPKWAGVVEYSRTIEAMWLLRRAVFMPWELPNIIGSDRASIGLEELASEFGGIVATPLSIMEPMHKVAWLETFSYMKNQLLRDADWAAMAHGVEVRTPFVDRVVCEALVPSVYGMAVHGSEKELLATAARPNLPAEISHRRKTGFALPMRDWLAQSKLFCDWRSAPFLADQRTPWARRWSYTIGKHFEVI